MLKQGFIRALRRSVVMIAAASVSVGVMSTERADAGTTDGTAVQDRVSATTGPVGPQAADAVVLLCNTKRAPIIDLSSLKLSALNAEDRDKTSDQKRYYDASPATWWFDVDNTESQIVVTFYNRHAAGSNVSLVFGASAKCKSGLQRRKARTDLLDSQDVATALVHVKANADWEEYGPLPTISNNRDGSPIQVFFESISSQRGVPSPVTRSWSLGDDELTLLACDGRPTIWDATTSTWWTRSPGFAEPPPGGDPAAPVKQGFVPHHAIGAPAKSRPICADFAGTGHDQLMLAASSQSAGWFGNTKYTENFYAPSTQIVATGNDTVTYASTATTSVTFSTGDKLSNIHPVKRRVGGATADSPGFIAVGNVFARTYFMNAGTTSEDYQSISITGTPLPISGDTAAGAYGNDDAVGLWSAPSNGAGSAATVNVQTFVRPIGQPPQSVELSSSVTAPAQASVTVQSVAQLTDQTSISAITKRVLSNEATLVARNPNLGKCVDVWNGGVGTNHACTSVANDPNFASAFRLVPSVTTTGNPTGWYQLVGSGPSVDECFGIAGQPQDVRNGSTTGLFPCLPGVSKSVTPNAPAVIDWKVTTAEKYGTVAAGTDISTLPAPPPASIPLTFTAAQTSMRLDLDGNNTQAGTKVTVGVANTSSVTQRWVLARTEAAEVLHNKYWDSCDDTWAQVDTYYGTLQDCSNFGDSKMASYFDEVPTPGGAGTFQLQATTLGSTGGPVCFGVPDPSNDVTPRFGACDALNRTEWQWTHGPDGSTGQLQLAGTNMCLDNRNGTYQTHNNTVVIGACDTAMQSQVWDTVAHMTLARGR